MKKVVVIILIVLMVVLGITYGVVDFIKKEEVAKKKEEERIELMNLNASLVIDSVELAYTTALTKNMGVYPTLEQVKDNFSNEHATWENDDKIVSYENDFECSVVVQQKRLKVTCLDHQTESNLIVRN